MPPPRFAFGPPPTPALLSDLGLTPTLEALPPASAAAAHLSDLLTGWSRLVGERAEDAPPDAAALLDAARLAGVRAWAGTAFALHAVVAVPDDLRCWLRLQATTVEHLADAFPVRFGYSSPGGEPLSDREVLTLARTLLDDADAGCPPLTWLTPDDVGEYDAQEHALDFAGRLPSGLRVADLREALNLGFRYAADLAALFAWSPPPVTAPPRGRDDFAYALGALLGWLDRADRPDGPLPPDGFRIGGVVYDRLTRPEMLLLEHLQSAGGQDGVWRADLIRLSRGLYGEPFRESAVRNVKKRLSRKLSEAGFPGSLEERRGFIVLTIRPG